MKKLALVFPVMILTCVVGVSFAFAGGHSESAAKVALLLPENKTPRYEAADRPFFVQSMKKLMPNVQIIYSNANQDANRQLSQAEAALTDGAQVLLVDPVDSTAAAAIANKAKTEGVPVIAYDRLIMKTHNVEYYIGFNDVTIGAAQVTSLYDRLQQLGFKKPSIVMINGSPVDNNAVLYKKGAHSVMDRLVSEGKVFVAKEYDTPDWSPDQAQTEMQQALTALGNKVDGVYCANDGTASGAIAAMLAAGVSPMPPVTGMNADAGSIQRILAGTQYMTVYKPIREEAEAAATLAYDLLTKTPVPAKMTNGEYLNNGTFNVPSVLLPSVIVTKDNIKSTVIKDNFLKVTDICTAPYLDACKKAGLE